MAEMKQADRRQVQEGFTKGREGRAPDILGALGAVAEGGIGFIVDNISQPIADAILSLFDSGERPTGDSIKQIVSDIFSDPTLQEKIYGKKREPMAMDNATILGGK